MRRGRREQGEGKRNRRMEGGGMEDEEGRRMEEGGRRRGEWMTSNAWRAY